MPGSGYNHVCNPHFWHVRRSVKVFNFNLYCDWHASIEAEHDCFAGSGFCNFAVNIGRDKVLAGKVSAELFS